MNFVIAYSRYCAYCRRAGVKPATVQEFVTIWREGKAQNHAGMNYN